jgi:hypothetical protein
VPPARRHRGPPSGRRRPSLPCGPSRLGRVSQRPAIRVPCFVLVCSRGPRKTIRGCREAGRSWSAAAAALGPAKHHAAPCSTHDNDLHRGFREQQQEAQDTAHVASRVLAAPASPISRATGRGVGVVPSNSKRLINAHCSSQRRSSKDRGLSGGEPKRQRTTKDGNKQADLVVGAPNGRAEGSGSPAEQELVRYRRRCRMPTSLMKSIVLTYEV